ncbi:MAG: helix-turn-helix domain-containing protein [Arcicella sp.]|nr:helix-turn-helix domain-containing protein [Arcicella sp.]
MINNPEKIPVLKPADLDDFHYKSIKWYPTISQTKHQYYHINRIESYIQNFTFPLPPHRKTVHDFIFLKKGNSTRSKGLDRFNFKESELFFLPAFQLTQHEAMDKGTEGFYVHFDESIFHFLPKNFLVDAYFFFQIQSEPIILLSQETQNAIEPILERILSLYEEERQTDINLVAMYLLSLFEEIKKDVQVQRKNTKNAFSQVTEQFKNALSLHIYQKQSVFEYAELLNISPNYLNKCVKNTINRTAQDLLNEMLILEAKTLLKFSDLQVAEIAVKLCNQTPSNFSRFFKNQTGITPKEYLSMY